MKLSRASECMHLIENSSDWKRGAQMTTAFESEDWVPKEYRGKRDNSNSKNFKCLIYLKNPLCVWLWHVWDVPRSSQALPDRGCVLF